MTDAPRPARRLSFLDRDVTIRIFAAMALGVFRGWVFAGFSAAFDAMSGGTTNVPIPTGLPTSAAIASGK